MITSIITLFDGVVFSSAGSHCRICGASLKKHDQKKKQFATLIVDGNKETVSVSVVRYRCPDCGKLWYADEPFYKGTRHGIPVVDLALALSEKYPCHHTEKRIAALGISLDRGTVRRYALMRDLLPRPELTDMYGMRLPIRFMSLSGLVAQGRAIEGAELLAALGLPPTDRASLRTPPSVEEERDEEE